MGSPYDLLEIEWGEEKLRARPIAWNRDISAYDFNPEKDEAFGTEYETSCPKCGGKCSFKITDEAIICENCKATTANPARPIAIDVLPADNKIKEVIESNKELEDEIAKELEELDLEETENIMTPEDILDSLTKTIMSNEEDIEDKPKKKKKEKK